MPAFPLDQGFASLTIGEKTIDIDIYKEWSVLDEIRLTTDGKPMAEFWEAIVAHLCDLGFPRVSYFTANEYAKWHGAQLDALKKADPGESKPDLPASTGPESSTNPAT